MKRALQVSAGTGLTASSSCLISLSNTNNLGIIDQYTLTNGRAFRLFNIIDEYNREALTIGIDFSLHAQSYVG